MKKLVFLILLFFLPLVSAQTAQDFYLSNGTFQITISSDNVPASILLPLEDELQQVSIKIISPAAKISGQAALFSNDSGKLMLGFDVRKMSARPVTLKNIFPVANITSEFVFPGTYTDSDNGDIASIAAEIISGEEDQFMVVYKLADWTRENIGCVRSGELSQKASEILQTRSGSCDEAASLFIAMNRAVGIPARFVSGISYSGSGKWDDTGWAEIYYPQGGWIPYDIAKGQIGYVDLTHIAFKKDLDKHKILDKGFIVTGNISQKGPQVPQEILIKAFPLYDNVNFSSYNIIEVSVRNLRNQYVADEVTIAPSEGLYMQATQIPLVLGPYEERKERFTVKVNDEVDSRFIHSFPIVVFSSKNVSSETRFRALVNSPIYISGYFPDKVDARRDSLIADVSLQCVPEKADYYVNETASLKCIVKNTGRGFVQRLQVCLDSCEVFDIGVAKEKKTVLKKHLASQGNNRLTITAKNAQISRKYQIDIKVLDVPKIAIMDVSHPNSVEYGDKFFLAAVLEKESDSDPKNASIIVSRNGEEYDSLFFNATSRTILFEVKGSSLDEGPNVFSIEVFYYDGLGRKYIQRRATIVTLKNITPFQRIRMFFRDVKSGLKQKSGK